MLGSDWLKVPFFKKTLLDSHYMRRRFCKLFQLHTRTVMKGGRQYKTVHFLPASKRWPNDAKFLEYTSERGRRTKPEVIPFPTSQTTTLLRRVLAQKSGPTRRQNCSTVYFPIVI